MNILLWIMQILLSVWNIIGAMYMMGNSQYVAAGWASATMPAAFWTGLGILQIVLAAGLLLPGIFGIYAKFTAYSAAGLAVISLSGIILYSSYSGFPGMLWGLLPALALGFVAYGRHSLAPLREKKNRGN